MFTIHTAPVVRLTAGGEAAPDGSPPGGTGPAGAVHGGAVANGGGPAGCDPGGVLNDGAVAVSGDRIAAVGPLDRIRAAYPDARVRRWSGVLVPALVHDAPLPAAPGPRERVHALLRLGATAVAAARLDAEPGAAALRTAAARAGFVVLASPRPRSLVPAARADFAVFADDGRCVATVLAGRLVHRRA